MSNLDDLARKHHAYVASDGRGFRRKARILQSIWREEQGYEAGEHRDQILGSRLPMPWAEETLGNFLSETIRQVVRDEVFNSSKSKGKLYAQPRLFNDLLSSQPLCFNLFAELQQDQELATAVFQTMTGGRLEKVTAIEFEYSPGRGNLAYLGDRSAFDVYVLGRTPDGGKAFIGIEVKYHENLQGKVSQHRPRYVEIADRRGCFDRRCYDQLQRQPLQQLWRDHLLAIAHSDVDAFDDGFFALLFPGGNRYCAEAVENYHSCLLDDRDLVVWTLEDFTAAVKRHTNAEWIDLVIDRYLDFTKLERLS